MLLTVVLLGWVFVLRQALYLAYLASNLSPSYLSLWDYRRGPIAPIA